MVRGPGGPPHMSPLSATPLWEFWACFAGRAAKGGGQSRAERKNLGVYPHCVRPPAGETAGLGSVLALPSTSCVTLGPHASEPQFSMHQWGITVIRHMGLSALNEVIHVKCLLIHSILDVHDDCWRQGDEPSSVQFPEPTHLQRPLQCFQRAVGLLPESQVRTSGLVVQQGLAVWATPASWSCRFMGLIP